jgi:DNA polymerase kappa
MEGEDSPEEVPPKEENATEAKAEHESLKYQLLGPSLTKAGQDSVDQTKVMIAVDSLDYKTLTSVYLQVSEIIYEASKGSKFFNREEAKDKILTTKITSILSKKARLEKLDLSREFRKADQQIAELEQSRDLSQTIVHVDCDAFYAAVELLDRPELATVPFAVGGGVLTTCNYVARKYGCRSGMAEFVARKLCPSLVIIRLNFTKYTAKATEVRAVLAEYDARFESASIDEAYLNLTEYLESHDITAADAVQQMRDEISLRTKITVSAGIAANAKLAKICSNINKPNGQYHLPSDRTAIVDFMRDLPVRKVNGVGRVWERELSAVGIKTCGDVYAMRGYLEPLFGEKAATFLFQCFLGIGRTNVQPAEEYERKSIGSESTFRDLSDPEELRKKLRARADELEKDMRRTECKGRTLVLKIKLHTYEVFTRQVVTPKAVYLADDLYNYSLPMLAKLEQEIPGMKLRLMGLRCTHLVSMKKPDTRSFFGFKPPRKNESGEPDYQRDGSLVRDALDQQHDIPAGDEGEWEEWPDDLLLDADGHDRGDSPTHLISTEEMAKPDISPSRRHGKEIVPNPKPMNYVKEEEEEWWECPICGRPQSTDERQFNAHIDLCLSRRTILDTVQQQHSTEGQRGNGSSRDVTPETKKAKVTGPERKRGRPSSGNDPRQKKLCFG